MKTKASSHNLFLIVGLGNPGAKYQNTWHNLGFLVLDDLARQYGFPEFQRQKWSDSSVTSQDLADQRIILAKPQTFMNLSGRAVQSLVKSYGPPTTNIVVVHDDADLPQGQIRIAQNRGTAGHKGVDSIVKVLKTRNFIRIRIGARPKNYVAGSKLLEKFVLKRFAPKEEKVVAEVIGKTEKAIAMVWQEGAVEAMMKFN